MSEDKYEDTEKWNGNNLHFYIIYDSIHDKYDTSYTSSYKQSSVYFSLEEGAERAIREVVEPFVKEHPDFVWRKEQIMKKRRTNKSEKVIAELNILCDSKDGAIYPMLIIKDEQAFMALQNGDEITLPVRKSIQ